MLIVILNVSGITYLLKKKSKYKVWFWIDNNIHYKRFKNDIISGNSNQPQLVNDRISQCTDNVNSPCLFALANYNKVWSTKRTHADSELYDLIEFDNIPNFTPSDL
jgi:hypothetical protein